MCKWVCVYGAGRVAEYDVPVRLLENKNSFFAKLVAEYNLRSMNHISETSMSTEVSTKDWLLEVFWSMLAVVTFNTPQEKQFLNPKFQPSWRSSWWSFEDFWHLFFAPIIEKTPKWTNVFSSLWFSAAKHLVSHKCCHSVKQWCLCLIQVTSVCEA